MPKPTTEGGWEKEMTKPTMSREIKFRAWDKELGKMGFVLGVYLISSGWVDLEESSAPEDHEWRARLNSVDLMQFTGLKDKTGKEIYEGDIIEWEVDSRGKKIATDMEFRNDGSSVRTSPWINRTSEVIGNIYENPELLKGANRE